MGRHAGWIAAANGWQQENNEIPIVILFEVAFDRANSSTRLRIM